MVYLIVAACSRRPVVFECSSMLTLFNETDTAKQERDSATLALVFFGVGFANFVATPMLHRCFANVGEKMTR